MKIRKTISWILRLVAAIILLQTLYFKFTGNPESVVLFTKLGVEPWGRIATGIAELITSIFLLLPATVSVGAALGAGIMTGAIISHLTVIGIESLGDGGQLFILAIIVMVCCVALLLLERQQAINLYHQFFKSHRHQPGFVN